MNLKKLIENNLVLSVISLGAGIGLVLALIIGFFSNWYVQIKIDDCELRVAQERAKVKAVERNLGENKYFDIESLLVSRNELRQTNEPLEYSEKGRFLVDVDSLYWTYQEYSELKMMLKTYGLREEEIGSGPFGNSHSAYLLEETMQNAKQNPIFSWWSKDSLKLRHDEGDVTIYCTVSVQNLRLSYLRQMEAYGLLQASERRKRSGRSLSDFGDFAKRMRQQSEEDRVGLMLTLYLHQRVTFSTYYPKIIVNVEEIEKDNNSAYARVRTEFQDCIVDNKRRKAVYQIEEVFWVKRNDEITVVNMRYPALGPKVKTKIISNVNSWLYGLKLPYEH